MAHAKQAPAVKRDVVFLLLCSEREASVLMEAMSVVNVQVIGCESRVGDAFKTLPVDDVMAQILKPMVQQVKRSSGAA